MSPDKRQALPKHWFPIDFYLSQLSLALSHLRCINLQLSPLSSDHTSPKLRREWSRQYFNPTLLEKKKVNTTCGSYSDPGFNPSVLTLQASVRRRRRARCNRCHRNLEGDSSIHHLLKSWWWKQRVGLQRRERAGQTSYQLEEYLCTCLIREEPKQMKNFQGPSSESNHVLLQLPVL